MIKTEAYIKFSILKIMGPIKLYFKKYLKTGKTWRQMLEQATSH